MAHVFLILPWGESEHTSGLNHNHGQCEETGVLHPYMLGGSSLLLHILQSLCPTSRHESCLVMKQKLVFPFNSDRSSSEQVIQV